MLRLLYIILITFSLIAPLTPQAQALVSAVEEEDGSPSVFPWKIKVGNGSLTNNGDGTVTINTGSGSGDSVTVNSTSVDTTANFLDGEIDFSVADGGAGGPDDVTATLDATSISARTDTTIADADYLLFWDATDSALKKVDAAELTAGGAETNDLESVATNAGDAEVFVGTGADAGAYITGLAACAADEKIEYVPGSPDTFTCEAIGSLVDADVDNALTIAGGTIGTSAITLVQGTAPTPTSEGVIEWDTDDNRIVVGDGASQQTFYSGAHTTDTNANTICSGTGNYLDGEGNCDALVTNATHTGDVTGATALTIANGAVDHVHLGTDHITGATAVGTFESGDTFLCQEAGVGIRECDYDDLPAGGSDTNSVKEYFWPASATLPLEPVTAGFDGEAPISKDTDTDISLLTVLFDDTADEARGVLFQVPQDVDTSATVTFRFRGYPTTASTNSVCMNVSWHEVDDGENWDGSLTSETATCDAQSSTQDVIGEFTVTETVSNLGWVAGDLIELYLWRDGDNGSDNLSGDYELISFTVEIPRA